jgi:prepilin-type N-terminal cleavage/methylation domain-containing protein
MNIFKTKKSSSKLFGIVPLEYSLDRKNTRYQKLLAHLTFNKSLRGSRTRAFTLIELLVVISIIGFLSSVVLASTKTAREKAQDSKIVQELRQVAIAEQLYYDEHKTYSLGDGDNNIFAVGETKNTFLTKDLNIFSTKIAEAYNNNCFQFETIATNLVSHKYLSAVPKHPKDNGTNICYKAATTPSNFTAYADLSTGKRVGVILGDITVANLVALNNQAGDDYPRDTAGGDITSLSSIGDVILGLTGGSGTLITVPATRSLYVSIPYPYGSVDNDYSTYSHGAVATIHAIPDLGYSFDRWSGPNGWQCNETYSTTCEILMDGDKYIYAMFNPPF